MIYLLAHKGFPVCGEENTVYSVMKALEFNPTSVEVDVNLNSNGLVCVHDSIVEGVEVYSMSLDTLKSKNIPFVSEIVDVVSEYRSEGGSPTNASLILDVKLPTDVSLLKELIFNSLKSFSNTDSDVFVSCTDTNVISSLYNVFQEKIKYGVVEDVSDSEGGIEICERNVEMLKDLRLDFVSVDFRDLSYNKISILRSINIEIFVHTVNNLNIIEKLADLFDISYFFTDRIDFIDKINHTESTESISINEPKIEPIQFRPRVSMKITGQRGFEKIRTTNGR